MATILIVEDDQSLCDVLSYNLKQADYEIVVARDGQDGVNRARQSHPDLIILDLMLPVLSGLDVCRLLRADTTTADILILMLTAKAEETDQVVGFTLGADDYVTKPFSVNVLMQRIKSLLRRRDTKAGEGDVVSCHGITVDRLRHRVTTAAGEIELTPSEFNLLDTLLRQPGRAFSRVELIDASLGDDALVLDRTIDVHVRALRKKLGDQSNIVETVRGVGYRCSEA